MPIVAQGAVDPISGGAGWVGAGLLGLVLGWLLLSHLPRQFSLIREIMKSYSEESEKVRQAATEGIKMVCDEFSADIKAEREVCAKGFADVAKSLENLAARIPPRHGGAP